MMRHRAAALLCAAAGVALIAAACTAPTTPGGGTPTNLAPIAVVSALPTAGPAPLTVDFSAAGSTDPDGTIAGYAWNFGDGTTGTGAETSHDYPSEGTYTVTLTVTDNGGATGTATQVVEVSEDVSGVVFVDDAGTDDETCGELGAPCASIAQGLDRAVAIGGDQVRVADGTYGAFAVVAGIDVLGGYDDDFLGADGTTEVTGAYDGDTGVSAAIRATNVNEPTTLTALRAIGAFESANARPAFGVHVSGSGTGLALDGVDVAGGASGTDATGVLVDGPTTVAIEGATISSGLPSGAGASAYGLRALGGAVVVVTGGSISAADGLAGAAAGPAPAAPGPACNGAGGGNASGPSSPGNGGAGCGGAAPTASGAGGRGGEYSGGGSSGQSAPSGAPGGAGGCGSLFGCGDNAGGGGAGSPGAAGTAGAGGTNTPGGTETYLGANGAAGTGGASGSGAGGGGGGKSASASGGGGGGGGAGGTGGAAATVGGGAGGGSFGVYSFDASVELTGVEVTAGSGGNGGVGQAGGHGGSGGAGGGGGTKSCCSAGGGGGGGGGGAGGGGGGAGGGAGGPSIAVLHRGNGVMTLAGNALSAAPASIGGAGGAGGAAGAGGAGGAGTQDAGSGGSAGTGNAGATGAAGAVGLVLGSWDNGVTTSPSTTTPTTTTTSTTTTLPATTTAYTPVAKTCQTVASGQTRINANPTGATVTAPTTVAQGSTFQVELTPDPMTVPTEGEGYPIGWIANVTWRFKIPAGTSYVGATWSGGSGLGTGTITVGQNDDDIVLTVPGTLAPGATAVMPKVTATLTATGAVGSSITTQFGGVSYADPSHTFQTRVNGIPFLGSVTSNSRCYAPVNTVLSTTVIG
jgi:PKD repeat protein